jgi:putative DNA primase/helicase
MKFLAEVLPNDSESPMLLQEWFGYNCVADTSMEKLMMLVGRPGAGKGTVLEALRAMLGPGQVASTSFDGLTSEFGLDPLRGRLAAILPDAHITKRGDPTKALEIIKSITGRDMLSINRKHIAHMPECKLGCRLTITCNDLPELPDHGRSLERRLNLLYFGQSFEGREDTTLKDRIVREAPGIVVWALEGLKRLRRNGKFTVPTKSVPVIGELRRVISAITEFVDDACEIGNNDDCYVEKNLLFEAYIAWAKRNDQGRGSRTRFGIRLLALFPGIRSDRRGVAGKQIGVYAGIRLTEEGMRRYIMKDMT